MTAKMSKTRLALLAQIEREGAGSEAHKLLCLYSAIATGTGRVSSALWYSLVHVYWVDNVKTYTFGKGIEQALRIYNRGLCDA